MNFTQSSKTSTSMASGDTGTAKKTPCTSCEKCSTNGENATKNNYYTSDVLPISAITVIDAFFANNFYLGNVFKYMARAGKKPGNSELEDLRKALDYLNRYVALLEGDAPHGE